MHVNMYLVNQFSSDRQNLSSFQILTITISKGPPAKYVCAFPCVKSLKWNFRVKGYILSTTVFLL